MDKDLQHDISIQDIANNFQVGEVISYKEIMKRLHLPTVTGNQKKAQLKKIECFMGLEKIKTKYLITEIYDSVHPINRQTRKDAVYIPAMNIFLLNYLSQYKEGIISHTSKQWWELIGMINQKYITAFNNKNEKYKALFLDKNMDKYNIDIFFKRTSNKFSSVFKKSLEALKKRGFLKYREVFVIIENNNKRTATSEEEREIMRIRKNILENMGLEEFAQLFYIPDKSIELFFKRINSEIKNNFGWDKVYEEIEINYLPEYIPVEMARDKKKLQSMSDQAKIDLNEFCQTWSRNNAEYEYNKKNKLLAFGIDSNDTINPFLQNLLTDEYIKV